MRAIGLSNYKLVDVEHCHKQRSVNVVQDGLSLIDYSTPEMASLVAAILGIGVVAYEPVASGILTGKTKDEVLRFGRAHGLTRRSTNACSHLAGSSGASRSPKDCARSRHGWERRRPGRDRLGLAPARRERGDRRPPRRLSCPRERSRSGVDLLTVIEDLERPDPAGSDLRRGLILGAPWPGEPRSCVNPLTCEPDVNPTTR